MNYNVSVETSSLLMCIEELNQINGRILESLYLSNEESVVEREIAPPILENINKAREELYKVLANQIQSHLIEAPEERTNTEI